MQINQTNLALNAYQSLAQPPRGGVSTRYAAPASVTRSDLAEIQISSEGQFRADAAARIERAAATPSAPMSTDAARAVTEAVRDAMVADPNTARAAQAGHTSAETTSRLIG